jgi:ferritin
MKTLNLTNWFIIFKPRNQNSTDMKKNKNHLSSSLAGKTEKMLNNQVLMEGKSSAYYLSMASWCDLKGYMYSAKFLYNHAEEERMHMLKLVHYINDSGGHALQPEITGLPHSFKSLREIFELILEHEIKVTHSISEIVDYTLTIKDFATFNFMQWYVSEQREEELLSRRAVELFDIIGVEGTGLWTIDQEIGKLEQTVSGNTGSGNGNQ